MTFTPQQAEAIYTLDKNLVVSAGAGSGKTRVLVERYLEILAKQSNLSLNAIVAITFTESAAQEMRDRVRQELEKRVREVEQNERPRWSNLLGEMDSARISTIHSLCAKILRANAAEAGIDPQFAVLDEIDADLLLDEVLEDVLRTLAEDHTEDTNELFSHYDTSDILNTLRNRDLLTLPLTNRPTSAETLFTAWEQQWESDFRQKITWLIQDTELRDAFNWTLPRGLTHKTVLESWENIQQHRSALFQLGNLPEALHALKSLAEGAIRMPGGKANDLVAEAKIILALIRNKIQAVNDTLSDPPTETDRLAAAQIIRWYRLIERVQTAYQEAKQFKGALDFNDLELRTAELLQGHEAIRQRYRGAEFKYLLVDEFQDTNQAQWEIVKGLADLNNGGSVFVVGDLKQSIYGFRGADVRVFSDVRAEIAAYGGKPLALSESFRSHRGLIDSFNTLFQRILTRDPHSPIAPYQIQFDEPMQANRDSTPPYTPLELWFWQEQSGETKLKTAQIRQWEAYEIGKKLQTLVAEQAPVWDKRARAYRPFEYGDAALLFQSMGNVNIYESVLKALNIPFVTVAGRGYYNRQEVWDMLNLLKALHNPFDNLSLATVLRSPLFGLSDDVLLALRRITPHAETKKPVLLWEALRQVAEGTALLPLEEERVIRSYSHLRELQVLAGRVTVAELLRQALALTGYLAVLTGLPDGARRRRNVEKLLTIAERSGRITPSSFWQYLEHLSAQEVREGEALLDTTGAVRLMTIHASKGLEFPVVFLPDAGWLRGGNMNSPLLMADLQGKLVCKVYDEAEAKNVKSFAYTYAEQIQQEREYAERKRLLYVAATRAQDLLIISGIANFKEGAWGAKGWLGQIIEAVEILDEQNGALIDFVPDTPLLLRVPRYDPTIPDQLASDSQAKRAWQKLDQLAQHIEPQTPPLLQPIIVPPERFLGHIAATQLAELGVAKHSKNNEARNYHRSNVRRVALHDTQVTIKDTIRRLDPRVTQRIIGDMVHEALRYWRFPDNTPNIEAVLRSYAWQQNLTEERDIQHAIREAQALLKNFQRSDPYNWIMTAHAQKLPLYPELPFIFRTEKRILHGIIDILLQRPDGTWVVVDYKTVYVPHGTHEAALQHAQRYALQVGAYAAAIYEQIQVIPSVYIHYIRYNRTIEIPTADWQAEIQQLEQYIGDVIGSRDD